MVSRLTASALLLALALRPGAAFAFGRPSIETHLGLSSARLMGDVVPNWDVQRAAIAVGALVPLTPMVSIEPAFGFVGRGGDVGKRDIYDVYGTYYGPRDVRIDVDYLQFPVLLRAAIGHTRLRPVLMAGSNLSVKTGERYRVNDLKLNLQPSAANDVATYDLGFMGGFGLELDSPAGTWMLESRGTWGTHNIMRDPATNGTVHNRDVQVVFGLRQPWPGHN